MHVLLGHLSPKEKLLFQHVLVPAETPEPVQDLIGRLYHFWEPDAHVVEIAEVIVADLERQTLMDAIRGTIANLAPSIREDFCRTDVSIQQLSDSELIAATIQLAEWLLDQSRPTQFLRPKTRVDRLVDAELDWWIMSEGIRDDEDLDLQYEVVKELRKELYEKHQTHETQGDLVPEGLIPPPAIVRYRQIKHQQRLYDRLTAKKACGGKLAFDQITRDELVQLWCVECIPDSMIAELFDVPKKVVTKRRHGWDIMQYNPF